MTSHKIIRLPAVISASGLSRSTIYAHIEQGLFTRPVQLGARAVGWPEKDLTQILEARISGKTTNEIRDLVKQLETARKLG